MNLLNAILTRVMEWILFPLSSFPLIALLLISVSTGILVTLAYRYTSNQVALRAIADRIQAHLLAIKLFKDDVWGMFGSLARILQLTVARLWYSLAPVAIMLIPISLLLVQLALRFEHRPLLVGETSVVELKLTEDAWQSHRNLELQTDEMIAVETAALRDDAVNSVFWRIRPKSSGTSTLRWDLGASSIEKQIVVGDKGASLQNINRRRAGSEFFDQFINPGEPSLAPESPVSSIEVHYPRRATPIAGWQVPWWLTFAIVSIVVAMAMQGVFGVRF